MGWYIIVGNSLLLQTGIRGGVSYQQTGAFYDGELTDSSDDTIMKVVGNNQIDNLGECEFAEKSIQIGGFWSRFYVLRAQKPNEVITCVLRIED